MTDLSYKQVPLVLTSSKVFTSPTDSGMFKKRRLSECSDSSNTNSISDKSSLNERFLELSLENNSKLQSPDDQVKIEDTMPNLHTITIPKPVRLNQARAEDNPLEIPSKNDNFFGNLIKMSQNDVQGISKYLNLDINAKFHTWEKMTSSAGSKEKFKMSSIFTSFLSTPLNNPYLKPELFSQNLLSDSQASGSTHSDSEFLSQKFHYKEKYIGNLTQEQRQEKINKYMEKKNNRKWKHIRYNIRKDLADKRERVQGRFVKTPKMFSHSDLMTKDKEKEKDKMLIENGIRNNSDFTTNHLSLSSSLGKRSAKSDLFEDSSTSM